MEELKRLVAFIDKYSLSPSPLLNLQDESVLDTKLFHLLKSGEIETDEDAAKKLYGNSKSATSYRMLKSRFRKKLYNHLHFLKVPTQATLSINEAKYQCSVLITEAYALRVVSELKLSTKVLEQALQIADKHELWGIRQRVLEDIKFNYYGLGDQKNYERISDQLSECYRQEIFEREAKELYEFTMLCGGGLTSDRRELIKYLPDVIVQFEELWGKSKSSMIYNYLHQLKVLYLEQLGNYAEIAAIIDEAESLVKKGVVNKSWFSNQYNNFIRIYALLQSKQYSKGISLAEKHLPDYRKFSVHWFAFIENYLLLTLYNQDYGKTAEVLAEASSGGHFLKLKASSIERLELFRRYFAFIIRCKSLDITSSNVQPFTVDLSFVPKDKSGLNLSLLILEVMEDIARMRFKDMEQQAERVRKYRVKYLKGERAERPRLFLRLLQMALLEQDYETTRVKGEKLLGQLAEAPLPGDAFSEVEIIPYEHLWELVLNLLQKKQAVT
ncbi:hypothetical protein [Pontibacter oryzae]|uniref:Uncharacterized protein n=1 Tax=Pontibacter oryzae TaxID=2304593 RepID=A0A399SDY6_9BACT|nr:hypothetical protein [Pontibacter oryzae]RIJ41408.1 hypothetical protein D1627_05035 [Pontibacter oryzae]